MRVEPRVPVETADASRGAKGPRQFLINTVLVVLFFAALYVALGWISDGIVHAMPQRWEESLAFAAPLSWSAESVPDEVAAVFERVREASGSDRSFTLHVIDTPEVNAMALAGGRVGLTRGFLEQVSSEEELAFVLSHEIGHIEHRHPLKRMSRSVVFSLARGILFGGDASAGVMQRAQDQADLRHSRRQELQADRFALDTLYRAYGHVGGATHFFESFREQEKPVILLRTHPLPDSRIDRVDGLIRERMLPVRSVSPMRTSNGELREEGS